MSDQASEFLTALQLAAADYRHRYRTTDAQPYECVVSHSDAATLTERYGSLQAAADAIFDPGSVKIVDYESLNLCAEVTRHVNLAARAGWRTVPGLARLS